ncbi:endonuclease III [miscellaneous Crenarchaeota group archaeon SMTZ-80]|nr:MAG: endonuclease III [miscellaneous Crenarchaeota group archaeon SMTZ-80]
MNDAEKKRVRKIIKLLKKNYPEAKIALKYKNLPQLLVAVMLSAQCTDLKINEVTKDLFQKYKSAEDFADADLRTFEKDIRSTGFYKVKARHIKESFEIIVKKYDSKIPPSMDDLIKLPGVARKTANIVLSNAYGIVEGIAVDTHVTRLSQRLNLTHNNYPDKIEQDLMKSIPKKDWFKFTYLLIEHGRQICSAKKPLCNDCLLNKLCPSAFKFN